MIRLVLSAAMSLFCISCATTRETAQSWCDDKHVKNETLGDRYEAAVAYPIDRNQLQTAYGLLSERSLALIDSATFEKLSSRQSGGKGEIYYLLRSGIFASDDAAQSEMKVTSDASGRRSFQFREMDRHLTIFTFQGVKREKLHPFPILVGVRHNVRSAKAYCYSHF